MLIKRELQSIKVILETIKIITYGLIFRGSKGTARNLTGPFYVSTPFFPVKSMGLEGCQSTYDGTVNESHLTGRPQRGWI